jgi:DNA polymerase delta subunit 4
MPQTISSAFRAQKQSVRPGKDAKQTKAASKVPLVKQQPQDVKTSVTDITTKTEAKAASHLSQLDAKDPAIRSAAQAIHDVKLAPMIHADPSDVQVILRDFDLTGKYGPCVGISRIERFERAEKLGLQPPAVVGQILKTQQGGADADLARDLFFGRL